MSKRHKLVRPDSLVNDAWLRLGNLDGVEIENELLGRCTDDQEQPGLLELRIMRNPEYLGFAAKVLLDIDVLPEQAAILQELWVRPFPMYIASRGFGKSFLMALYATLRCTLCPGTRVVGVGAAFRQARVIYEYMDTIWKNAPILRSVCTNESGPRQAVDRCSVILNDSSAIFVPLGDGSKIRGLRANVILADEFASIPTSIYETVVRGFAAVEQRPIDGVQAQARKVALESIGKWTAEEEEYLVSMGGNQCIISGTADYDFMPFADYWKKYIVYIRSKGDPNKMIKLPSGEVKTLKDYFEDGIVPEAWNHRNYSIIRIPYKLIPKGFMDDRVVAEARASTHKAIFQKEYGACKKRGTLIITEDGVKTIEDIVVNDMVLTHKGRFRPVTKCMYRKIDEEIVNIKCNGYNQYIGATKEHPWFDGRGFIKCDDAKYGFLSNLNELNGLSEIHLKDYCTKYIKNKGFMYSDQGKHSQVRIKIIRMLEGGKKPIEIAKELNISPRVVYSQRYRKLADPKNKLPKSVKLNYDLGLCIGYYAAEGSYGANGRQLSFSLDGHVDKSLECFVRELKNALRKVFKLEAKEYKKKHNTVDVTLNSRLLVELFSAICPGNCYTKYIVPQILYSNEEFLKGFLVGYWNGDGSISNNNPTSGSSSIQLSTQVRTALSYFKISSTLNERPEGTCTIRGETYKTHKHFRVVITGENRKVFFKELYNKQIITGSSKRIIQCGDYTRLDIADKFTEHYKGYVYNLEVKEDNSYSTLGATVHNCFPADSDGFFKRSLIESCVAKENDKIELSSGMVHYSAAITGVAGREYVFGVDPAAESDNFAVTVLELWPDHTRIVYGWSTNIQDFQRRKKAGTIAENDYYGFCARKIRNLMKVFPTDNIALDAQGGGLAVLEAFHDPNKMESGEHFLWPTNDILYPDKELPSDAEQGKHIIHMCQFANFDFTSMANHGTRKDLEDKVLLFPEFDPLTLEFAHHADGVTAEGLGVKTLYDTLEDCVMEIEELKDELSTIVMTRTGTGVNGRDRWDTPETTTIEGKKRRMRKDRYSALMMANFIARSIHRTPAAVEYSVIGGFAHQIAAKQMEEDAAKSNVLYTGPAWFTEDMNKEGGSIIVHVRKPTV